MKVFNVSKSSVLAENISVAATLSAKSKGLIGKSSPAALFFKTRWGIHTFGMKFPIDCIVCDADWKVKTIRKDMPPNRIFFWSPRYANVLELPVDTIKRTNTEIGDRLLMEDNRQISPQNKQSVY